MGVATAGGARLSKEARREHLLDVAADMLVERGAAALTMEGLAERAGVSKALPYAHFDNAADVVNALYAREVAHIGASMTTAVSAAPDGEAQVRAAIHAYFDIVGQRGRVLSMLTAIGATAPGGDPRLGHRFVAEILEQSLGLNGKRGLALATIIFAATHGAIESWAHRDLGRAQLEEMVVRMILSGARGD